MTYQHQDLAAGRWQSFSLMEQLANVGSEVGRAIAWQRKNREELSRKAAERALELMSLTLDDARHRGREKELARVYEVLVDYFFADNCYQSTDVSLERYFSAFNYAARRNR